MFPSLYPAPTAPIIMLGPHRSGTSLVARIINELGVYTGWLVDVNNESRLFIALNEWLLRQAGTSWEYPAEIDRLLADQSALNRSLVGLKRVLGSRFWTSTYRPLRSLAGPWGWKDPRNCATLPIWLELYPAARLVLVERERGAAAESLVARRDKALAANLEGLKRYSLAGPLKPGPSYGIRSGALGGAEAIISDYERLARRHVEAAGRPVLKVQYEDLVKHPHQEVARIASELGLAATRPALANAAALVRRPW